MRVVALQADVLVFVSDVWQTISTAVRAGEEGFLIDSPVYPEELHALPEVCKAAGFPVSGVLATHGDWDHLLARLAFPGVALGCAESTAARLAAEPGAAQRELRSFDQEHYVQGRSPLALGALQSLPVPGRIELGPDHELELYESDGHTGDGAAYWMAWLSTLVCGDYLSPVEIPVLAKGGSIDAYRATLGRLRGLAAEAKWVVPGHGEPLSSERALAILAEDDAYLESLARDPNTAPPPPPRASPAQARIHAANRSAALG